VKHPNCQLPTYNSTKHTLLQPEVFLPKSLSDKVATYSLNQWAVLNRYLEYGNLSIGNTESERAMCSVGNWPKNLRFTGSKPGHRAAILMSMIASCKSNLMEP